jgi:chromosome partitioning protein
MTAKKISIINMKGGVGKTTLSIHLAYHLSKYGGKYIQKSTPEDKGSEEITIQNPELGDFVTVDTKRVLLIDLDPQANASIVAIPPKNLDEHYKSKKTILSLFFNWMREYGPFQKTAEANSRLEDYIYKHQESENFHIIPSKIELSSLLRGVSIGPYELDRFLKGESPYQDKIEEQYDFIIIDCAPTYSILTTLALNATDQVLIPMTADPFSIHGTKLMQHVLDEHEHDFGRKPNIMGVVFTMWDSSKKPEHQEKARADIRREWTTNTRYKDTYIFGEKMQSLAGYKILNGKVLDDKVLEGNNSIDFMELPVTFGVQEEHKKAFVSFIKEFLDRVYEKEK